MPQSAAEAAQEQPDVRTQVRDAILRGAYVPRQRLIESDLAARFGASRFALRNALIALAAEGLVELQPNRGARVREISLTEAVEITEVRRAVESLVAARAAENATAADVERLRRLGAEMRDAVAQGELQRYSELNAMLHADLRQVARHAAATAMLDKLNGQVVRHQFRLSMIAGRPTVSLPEHLAIIEAVCARDPAAASAAMTAHVDSVITALRSTAQGPALWAPRDQIQAASRG